MQLVHIELHLMCRYDCMFCLAVACIYSVAHASYVLCIVWWISCVDSCFRFASSRESSASCRMVRTRSTTSVRLLHGGILLPSGISGKRIISPDTITIIAMLVLPLLPSMSRCLPHVKYQPLNNAMLTLNPFNLANHWLAMLLLA